MKSSLFVLLLILASACSQSNPPAEPVATNPPPPHVILPPITNTTPAKPSLINDLTGKTAVDAGRRAAQSARESAAKQNARHAEAMEE